MKNIVLLSQVQKNTNVLRPNYFYIEAATEESVFFTCNSNYMFMHEDEKNWTTYDDGYNLEIVPGKKMYIKSTYKSAQESGTLPISGYYNAGGNAMLLFDNDILQSYHFSNLFKNTNIVVASQLILPATTLASSCYYNMFRNCTSLTTAPELPATTLAQSCYLQMFYGCTSLATAPELPATKLATYCYEYMFYGCSSLTTAPELPATTLTESCYSYMFSGCTSLTAAPELPATTLASNCYNSMFYGCSSLTAAPELPATTLMLRCYNGMFSGCSSLTAAPELPATTLTEWCYYAMFDGCSKLNEITMLATDISPSTCLSYWVRGVASIGTFIKNAAMTSLPTGINGIPSGWAVEDYYCFPSIINILSTPIDFNYDEGMYTPTVIVELTKIMSEGNILSLQPICDITVNVINKDKTLHTSDYLWVNTKTLYDVMQELNISNINDFAIVIIGADIPEDNGYYYYDVEETEPFVDKDWMRIVSLEDGNEISASENVQYSINGADWKKMDYNTITVNANDIVYFKGTEFEQRFNVSKKFNVEGNIMSLIYDNDFEGKTDLSGTSNVFNSLFSDNKKLYRAENLILPATTLAFGCYSYMFYNCTSLTTAPELPATTLAEGCYCYMFRGCTSLAAAPELPAITLADYCYGSMFQSCTSLTASPELPATTLAKYCYDYMFSYCTSLTAAPELPATTLTDSCYNCMFYGCTSLTTAPELPATTLAYGCYYAMFSGCTSLTTTPELPATTLTESCYEYMFSGCTNLNEITMLATDISAYGCLKYWVSRVASTGTFIKHPDMTSLPTGTSGIPSGWTVQNYSA